MRLRFLRRERVSTNLIEVWQAGNPLTWTFRLALARHYWPTGVYGWRTRYGMVNLQVGPYRLFLQCQGAHWPYVQPDRRAA